MKVGIITDTHDHMINIKKSVEIFKAEQIDVMIHAGDFIAPFSLIPFKDLNVPIHAVFGNNDGEKDGLLARANDIGFQIHSSFYRFELEGKIFLVHHYPIAKEDVIEQFSDCDYIITGHTHKKHIEMVEECETLLINPGEACGYVEDQNLLGLLDPDSGEYKSIEIK